MFERMKLGNKIVAGFAAVTLIAAVMGFVGVSGIRSTMMNLDEISDNRLPSVQSLLIMSESMYKVAVAERGLINRRMAEPQFRKAQYEFAERAMKRADAAWKVYESLPQGREEAAMWKEFVPRWEAWKKSHQPVLAGSLEKDRLMSSGVSLDDSRMEAVDEQVFKASQESRLRFLEIEQPLAKLVELNIALAKEASKSADADAARARALMIGAIVVTLLMAAAIGFYLRRNIAGILKGLVEECQRLSEAAVKGNLATRGDAQRINFEFRCVLEGMNRTLDAVIGPLNVAGEYVDRISKGDIPPKITDDYQGDFNEIKSNLNTCIDAVNALVADANMLSAAALEGKLATRADASRHQGDFRRVVDGVNHTLDAVIGPLNVAAEYVDRISKGDIPPKIVDSYQGDFNEMKNNLNTCIDAVSALVADARMLSVAAVEGRLATRADASRHQGDFRQVVDGVNRTLDAVIGPLNVAAEYVDRISKGDIPTPITDDYRGDFNELKINLNVLISAMGTIAEVAEKISHGDLAVEVRPRSGQDRLMLSLQNMVAVLKELASSAELIAAGDLTLTVRPASERDVMGNAFVAMVENLRSIVGNVSAGTASIATASRQIAAGSADMAQRTEQQAASLEETAASMEELTSTVKQNAENSQQANQLAIAASDVAVKGGAVIGKVVTTMDSISDSSKKISDIIGVIDGIAFQTNILALNAAVEAARAGEQGRGFAVVAGEVRNLAQRSAAAAKEIKSLIGDSVDKVGSGSKLVGEAGQTMQEIVASIKRVTEIVAEISAASVEQSCGIEQINIAITSMDEMTQQNSSIVQQSAAAADSLQEQAGLLVEAVNGFKLVGGQRGAAGGARMEGFAASPGVRQQPPPLEKVKKANGYHKTMTASGRKAQGAGQAPPILAMAVGDDADWNGYS